MQNNGIYFNSYENSIMKDTAFLLAKREIIQKTVQNFDVLAKTLSSDDFFKSLSARIYDADGDEINFQGAKISKGENYKGLPYVVLDHPRYFDKENIFTFRSMFWWGNFYSFTLHLQGSFLENVKRIFNKEKQNFETGEEIYISSGNSQWEYHYEEDNYIKLTKENASGLIENSFKTE